MLSRERRAELVAEVEAARGPSALGLVDVLRQHGYRGGWGTTHNHGQIILTAPAGGVLADAVWGEPESGIEASAELSKRGTPDVQSRATVSASVSDLDLPDDAYRVRW